MKTSMYVHPNVVKKFIIWNKFWDLKTTKNIHFSDLFLPVEIVQEKNYIVHNEKSAGKRDKQKNDEKPHQKCLRI